MHRLHLGARWEECTPPNGRNAHRRTGGMHTADDVYKVDAARPLASGGDELLIRATSGHTASLQADEALQHRAGAALTSRFCVVQSMSKLIKSSLV